MHVGSSFGKEELNVSTMIPGYKEFRNKNGLKRRKKKKVRPKEE